MPIRSKKHRFTNRNISNSPSDIGVYTLSEYSEMIYIGRGGGAGGIKTRLQAAKRGDTRGGRKATSYQVERCKDPAKREKQLLAQYKKKHGKLPRYNDRIG